MSRVPTQVLAILAVAFALFVIWDFGQRFATVMRLSQSEQEYTDRIAHAAATQTALIEKKKYVQTDAYAEEVLRSTFGHAREGETVVRPLITPAATPTVSAPPAPHPAKTAPPEPPWWQRVWDLFFGP